ncbi:Di-trans-poly-cis-decaprenylcistransferase [Sparassis latifolia]
MLLRLISSCCRWPAAKAYSAAEDVVLAILAAGPIPQHVAFVMDGNRRYARKHGKYVREGHSEGFQALRRVLKVCLRLNIRCVSAYAFAIENFKRSPEEVDALMDLAENKLLELCQHGQLLDEYGVRLNVLGRKEMLPERVQVAVKQAEEATRHNTRAILNLCMPYGARDDIATAVHSAIQDALKQDPVPSEITEDDIESRLMTSAVGSPPLDILVRTSGVRRLSDFFLWQCCEGTQLQFSEVYWPDFGLRDFVPIILDYQWKVWFAPSPSSPSAS